MYNHTHLIAYVQGVWLLKLEVFSMGQTEGRGPHPNQHHPVPQGPPFSINHTFTTGSPPGVQKQSHRKHAALTTPKCTVCSQKFPHTPKAHHLGGAAPPPQEFTSFSPSSSFLSPGRPHDSTGVFCPINCQGLTFDLLTRPPKHLRKCQRSHVTGIRPPPVT